MELFLTRYKTGPDGTFGSLSWNGKSLVTLEKAWQDNEPDKSCVPAGTYELLINFSPHFDCPTPILLDVPCRTNIRIHPANWQTQLQGCIAVGEHEAAINGRPGLADSNRAFNDLMDGLSRTTANKNIITISDCFKASA